MSNLTFFIIESILQSSNASKQKLGQRMAVYLGLEPGPKGSDDGIDGFGEKNNKKIHFQSKLRNVKLDRDEARKYFSDIIYHKADVSIILSGVGFKDTFRERLFGHKEIENVEIYLLELRDIFKKTDSFVDACKSLPDLRYIDEKIKKIIEDY